MVPSTSGTLRWAKSHRGIAAAFCPHWEYSDPLALQCHSCSCPVPAQPGGHAATFVPAGLQQQCPDASPRSPTMANQAAKLRLIPFSNTPLPRLRAQHILGD